MQDIKCKDGMTKIFSYMIKQFDFLLTQSECKDFKEYQIQLTIKEFHDAIEKKFIPTDYNLYNKELDYLGCKHILPVDYKDKMEFISEIIYEFYHNEKIGNNYINWLDDNSFQINIIDIDKDMKTFIEYFAYLYSYEEGFLDMLNISNIIKFNIPVVDLFCNGECIDPTESKLIIKMLEKNEIQKFCISLLLVNY